VYGAVLLVASLVRVFFYWYVMRRPQLLWEPLIPRKQRIGFYLAAAPIAVYVVAMVVADFVPVLSLLLYLVMPLLYFVLITILRQRPATREEADEFS